MPVLSKNAIPVARGGQGGLVLPSRGWTCWPIRSLDRAGAAGNLASGFWTG